MPNTWAVTAGSLRRGSTYLRWVYLMLGAALVLAFLLVDLALAGLVRGLDLPGPVTVAVLTILVVAPPVLVGMLPAVREVEGITVESLLGVRFEERPLGPARTWAQRRRTALWFVVHLLAGGLAGIVTTIAVSVGAVFLAAPFRDPGTRELLPPLEYEVSGRWTDLWMPAVAVAGLALMFLLSTGVGALLVRSAPGVLGPTPTERIQLLERRTATLAERNRLARDLHDSVGHALSLVTLQAAAARRVLSTDPRFAENALAAMETSARAALADLDHVLGLLRDDRRDGARTAPQATLDDVPRLVEATRAGGITVEVHREGNLTGLPAAVSREAYRIVQEGLTNAVRHAGHRADELSVQLSIALGPTALRLEVRNPVAEGPGSDRPQTGTPEKVSPKNDRTENDWAQNDWAENDRTDNRGAGDGDGGSGTGSDDTASNGTGNGGGRGLAGIRERVEVLRGTVDAARVGHQWLLSVTLPVAVTTEG